jgi:hypothetical protein
MYTAANVQASTPPRFRHIPQPRTQPRPRRPRTGPYPPECGATNRSWREPSRAPSVIVTLRPARDERSEASLAMSLRVTTARACWRPESGRSRSALAHLWAVTPRPRGVPRGQQRSTTNGAFPHVRGHFSSEFAGHHRDRRPRSLVLRHLGAGSGLTCGETPETAGHLRKRLST